MSHHVSPAAASHQIPQQLSERRCRRESSQSQKRRLSLTDHEVYVYALRVAILHHVLAYRRNAAALSPASDVDSTTSTTRLISNSSSSSGRRAAGPAATSPISQQKRESLHRSLTEGGATTWTSTFASMSLSDLFRERGQSGSTSSSSAAKYPERFIKVLESRLELISRGSDAANSDMLMRYTIGAFYGKYKDPKNARMFKDGRRMEDLLMIFIATATDVLRKRCVDEDWKIRLEDQVEAFVRIIEECLRHRDVKHVPPDTFTKLDAIKNRISANRPSASALRVDATSTSSEASDNFAISKRADVIERSTISAVTQSSPPKEYFSVSEMPSAHQVGRLFNVDLRQLQNDVDAQRTVCTEHAALDDFCKLSKEAAAGGQMLPVEEKFPSREAYTSWQAAQLAELQQQVLSLTRLISGPPTASLQGPGATAALLNTNQLQPSLANSTQQLSSHSHTSIVERDPLLHRSQEGALGQDLVSEQYTFIPSRPRLVYVRLLQVMLAFDLAGMADLDPSEEVPLRILSEVNQRILHACAFQWRVPAIAQFVYFLNDMTQRYAAGEMPVVECIVDALSDFEHLHALTPYTQWQTEDLDVFLHTLSALFDALLRGFYDAFSEQMPRELTLSISGAIECVHDNQAFSAAVSPEDLRARVEQLREGIRRTCEFWYAQQCQLVWHDEASQIDIQTYFQLLDWLKSTVKALDRSFRTRLIDAIDVTQLFLSQIADLFFRDLQTRLRRDNLRQATSITYTTSGSTNFEEPLPRGLQDAEVMHLYAGVREVMGLHKAFCPTHHLMISLDKDFEPYVLRWLDYTHSNTLTWVRNAINVDDFKPSDLDGASDHTSSIVDLIASCKGAVQYVTDLQWPDPVQNAVFITRLSATISKAIEEYCAALEQLFVREMMEPPAASEDEHDERTSAWLTRAKALMHDKKPDAFHFAPESCLKLNNIHAARDLLDSMYTTLEADKVAAQTQKMADTSARINKRCLYTVKVVLGEGVGTADGNSRIDPFVTLSDESGRRLGKTRTLYETSEPRWSEAFDISVNGSMWIATTVWNRNLLDEHDLVGRAFVNLDTRVFGDCLVHDIWQDLDTTGRLLLRISMEGEKDDIQFHFGRAFRSLKRADNDMSRLIVDKIAPFIRSCLSTSSLRGLLRQGGLAYITANVKNLKLDKAFDKARIDHVRHMLRPKDPMALEIPLPATASDQVLGGGKGEPSATSDRRKAVVLTDAEIEQPLGPLLDYLDQCLEVFRRYLNEKAWEVVMTKIWKDVLIVIESLLVPPLADQASDQMALTEREVDVVYKWLKILTDFFYADGHGVPIEDLRNSRYRSIINIRFYYDWSTDRLMEECVRLTSLQLSMPSTKGVARTKSVYQQRNLGTIRQSKQDKHDNGDSGEPEMIMRILRMRPEAIDFIQQQLITLNLVKDKRSKPSRLLGSVRGGRPRRGRQADTVFRSSEPALPPIPQKVGKAAYM